MKLSYSLLLEKSYITLNEKFSQYDNSLHQFSNGVKKKKFWISSMIQDSLQT